MDEAQQFVEHLLSETGQAGTFFCLALGFVLGLMTAVVIFCQSHLRA